MNQVLAYFFYLFLRTLDFTYRYRYSNEDLRDRVLEGSGNYIFAVWHQNLLACILAQKLERHTMIVSQSKDGEFVSGVCERLGHTPARGSSTRGGNAAAIAMIKKIREGTPGAITVDGPKGPPHIVKRGIVKIAESTGAIILPYATYPEKFWSFSKSWDQFRIPKPFTRILVHYGDPIEITDDYDLEGYQGICEAIQQGLESTQEKARNILSDPQQLAQCKKTQGDFSRRNTKNKIS